MDVLANHWECVSYQQRFTCHDSYERHVTKRICNGGQPKLVCGGGKFRHIMKISEKGFYGGNTQFHGRLVGGLSDSLSRLVGTSIMHCAVMEGKGAWLLIKNKCWSMDSILRQKLSISSMDASGTDVRASQAHRDIVSQGPTTSTLRLQT